MTITFADFGEHAAARVNATTVAVVFRDDSPMNPLTDIGDLEPPMLVRSLDRGAWSPVDGSADIETPSFTAAELREHASTIAETLGFRSLIHLASMVGGSYYQTAADVVNDAISEAVSELSGTDELDALSTLLNVKGVPSYRSQYNGYAQGDSIDVVAWLPEKLREQWGLNVDADDYADRVASNLRVACETVASWAFGDVFGFTTYRTTEDVDEFMEREGFRDSEPLESVWGFFGDDHTKSGLAEGVSEAID